MKSKTSERFIYTVIVILSVIVLVLAVISASFLVDTHVVYQGF
jgi:hypothetical protein